MNKALSAEWAVVGALLLDNSVLSQIEEPIGPDDFIDDTNRMIWEAALQLIANGIQAETISVSDHLQKNTGREWLSVVGGIAGNTASTKNCSHYAAAIKQEAQKRAAAQIALDLEFGVARDLSAIDEAITQLMKLKTSGRNYDCTMASAVKEGVDELEAQINSGKIVGLTTGLIDLDDLLGGLQKQDLYVIGARPGMGKTAFMLNVAEAGDRPVGIASTEQGRTQIARRLLSINGYVSSYKMRVNQLDDKDWAKVGNSMGNLIKRNIYINDRSRPHINDIMSQARKWKYNHDIKLLMVDYIQRIRANPKMPRHEQVEDIAQSLKELARELDIPVVALAQVGRDVEKRPNKRPFISDLKDSGAIEQEADVIAFLYRDEVYNENTKDAGLAEIIVGKNRHGPLATIRATWRGDFMRFDNYTSGAA